MNLQLDIGFYITVKLSRAHLYILKWTLFLSTAIEALM
jgi:hypothetical protein